MDLAHTVTIKAAQNKAACVQGFLAAGRPCRAPSFRVNIAANSNLCAVLIFITSVIWTYAS